MKVLVVGGGAREHAMVVKIAQSFEKPEIFCAPGNDGIAHLAQCAPIAADDIQGLADFAEENKIDLTVVGPEVPLVLGIVDEFERRGLKIVGPNKKAAMLEGSKIFACEFMKRNKISAPKFKVFYDPEKAKKYVQKHPQGVAKADGLAAGKGVIIYADEEGGIAAIEKIMVKKAFGEAGNGVLIQEFISGVEASVIVATDGINAIPIISAQDYKKAQNGNRGLNTGGMGGRAPVPDVLTEDLEREIMDSVVYPALRAAKREGLSFKGFLYVAIMVVPQGSGKKPKIVVLEFNCRLGDPEWSVQSVLWENDIIPVLQGIANGNLARQEIKWSNKKAVCVVMASGGYPEKYEVGKEITGLENAAKMENVAIFHSGTKKKDEKVVTDGGRVLEIVGLGDTAEEACERAYQAVGKISWDGEYHRDDIASVPA